MIDRRLRRTISASRTPQPSAATSRCLPPSTWPRGTGSRSARIERATLPFVSWISPPLRFANRRPLGTDAIQPPSASATTGASATPHGGPPSRGTAGVCHAAAARRSRWITSSPCRAAVAMSYRISGCSVRPAIDAAPARNKG